MAVILLHGKKAGAKKVFSLKSNKAWITPRSGFIICLIPFFWTSFPTLVT